MNVLLLIVLIIEVFVFMIVVLYHRKKRKEFVSTLVQFKNERANLIQIMEEEMNKIFIRRDRIEALREELNSKQEILLELKNKK